MKNEPLPHWDMSVVFSGLDSAEFAADFAAFVAQIQDLEGLFNRLAIQKLAAPLAADQAGPAYAAVTAALNPLLERGQTLRAYITSFVSTDSRNALAQARMSEFQQASVRLNQLITRLTAWVGSVDVDALLAESPSARPYQYRLQQAGLRAKHLMSPAEEDLAAELGPSAGGAWAKLYNDLSSQINVSVPLPQGAETLPMSAVRNLAYDPDPAVRRAGYEAELASWQEHALPLAAAMNGIKGEVNTLAKRRSWASPLDAALFDNGIDRATLDAMMEAARGSFSHFRRYLQAKAHLLGQEKLPWYDLFAPAGSGSQAWPYADARELVITQFGGYSQRMGDFAARAFRENWIDAEPRSGKRDGAFCMGLRRDESRVMTNYQPGFKSVLTLAHELGHAYHNLNLAGQPMLNRETPMILAETASIFCETIVRNAMLSQLPPQERLGVLEASLVNATQIVVDISSRFLFEQAAFDQRQRRDVSVGELCQAMAQAQRETYGSGLDEKYLHPFMWAAKPHYYSASRSFYNYPYMFGLLFGLGLYARCQQDPADFKQRYDALLSSTGQASAADLAARMGIDIRDTQFWQSSLEIVRADIDQFVELSNAH
jgi:pepF/M3 family oligoendopeptidase